MRSIQTSYGGDNLSAAGSTRNFLLEFYSWYSYVLGCQRIALVGLP